MSRTLMTQDDIPVYVRDAVRRMYPAPAGAVEGEIVGYTFTLYGRFKAVYDGRLERDAERIVKWARRYYAEANIIGTSHFNKRIGKRGYVHFIHLNITDPVAKQLERCIKEVTV